MACDVTTRFVDAAEVFAPQKGATPAQVALLRRRLERLAEVYVRDYGVDVRDLPGSGAAGGLAGGLAAAGAVLVPGFDLVAEALDLAERIAGADLVVTGEGHLDAESFAGKAVGGVVALATEAGVPVLVVAGGVDADEIPADLPPPAVTVVSLVERFGLEEAMWDPIGCVDAVVSAELARRSPGGAELGATGGPAGPVLLDLDHGRALGHVGRVPPGPVLHAGPQQRHPQHGRGLGAELVERTGCGGCGRRGRPGRCASEPEAGGHVDQQGQVDAVALHERHLLEHLPAGGELAPQRLADGGQLGEEQPDARAGPPAPSPARPRPAARRTPSRSRSPVVGRQRAPAAR